MPAVKTEGRAAAAAPKPAVKAPAMKKKGVKGVKPMQCTIDCTRPVTDKILDVAAFVRFSF